MFGLDPVDPKLLTESVLIGHSLFQQEPMSVGFQRYSELFILGCDTFALTIRLKLNKIHSFIMESRSFVDLMCLIAHYSFLPWLGVINWVLISWIGSLHVLGDLILLFWQPAVDSNVTK
ncbi:hypothetical protein Ocin01_16374 [Orchesella cincta]|uniref:Uncharacterized protein n=1 Tax=Orchesella cincta TaxID=48709 RepID=A0A1D2MBC7_ORCCI|nr:hypothetical protein Ocin01_16374 [Orchesella cincta]